MRALAVLGVLAGLAVVLVEAQPSASFTAAEADAGRTAYEANCSACHLRDLKGSNEAAQLAGANFINQWGDKSAADLHAYLMASMPPTNPGGPGSQAMLDIVAYLLQANGGVAGSRPLARDMTITVRAATAGGVQPAQTAAQRPAGGGGDAAPVAPARRGLTVTGEVKNYVPVTDEMLRNPDPGDWLMARAQLSGLELQPADADHARQRRRICSSRGCGR